MRKIIHHIRKQPEAIKRHILHLITMVFAAILLFLWVYSLGSNFTKDETREKLDENLKPISALKENILEGYNVLSQPPQP